MKNYNLYILLFLFKLPHALQACGYYPLGEDVRWHMLNPNCFHFKDLQNFNYSCNFFPPLEKKDGEFTASEKQNIQFWLTRCHNKVTFQQVVDVLFNDELDNAFTQFLTKTRDTLALNYLETLWKTESLNTFLTDPWERQEYGVLPQRTALIETCIHQAKRSRDKDLSLRYAFLAIRLAYYNQQPDLIRDVYQQFFKARKSKTIVDYWALHFFTLTENPGPYKNFCAAQVFLNASDKRFIMSGEFSNRFPIEDVLKFASNDAERFAVQFLSAIRNPARCFHQIQELLRIRPQADETKFIVLRELNKLEDWIYTPYYSHFEPSIRSSTSTEDFASRIQKDRQYAGTLLNLINVKGLLKKDHSDFYKIASSYLAFMSTDHEKATAVCASLTALLKEPEQILFIKRLSVLNELANNNTAQLSQNARPLLMMAETEGHQKFMFAVARELEFKNNKTQAAFIFSKVNQQEGDGEETYWRSKKGITSLYSDFYTTYFYYLDAEYSTAEIKQLIHSCETNLFVTEFDKWLCAGISKDLPRLYDLLGTKYLRENKLHEALAAFKKVGADYWQSASNPYTAYLDANPFYTTAFNEHKKTSADTIRYTKTQVVEKLMKHIQQADNPASKDRGYSYFLAANCYLNMSYYGNSWIMRRYYWSGSTQKNGLADDDEYWGCSLARNYYLKAYETSNHPAFKALALRMAGRCEKYRLMFNEDLYTEYGQEKMKEIFRKNIYYKQLKTQYPLYYDELISNCEAFPKYFSAR